MDSIELTETDLDEKPNNGPEVNSEKITCVSQVIGEFGPWQRRFYFYFAVVYLLNVFHNFGIIFFGARSDYWCRDRVQPNMTDHDWSLIRNKCFDDCSGYDIDKSKYHRTIFGEFELVCSRSWLVSIASSAYQIGYLISSILISYFSDRFGRKPTFKLVAIMDIFFCGVQAVAPNIQTYLIAQVLLGITAYGRFLTGVLLIMETAGSKKKAILQVAVELSWSAGVYIFLLLFFFVSDFRYLKAIACLFGICGTFWFSMIPESIRWLLSKGRYDEARQLLLHACQYNHKVRQTDKSKSASKATEEDQMEQVKIEKKIDLLLQHFIQQEHELVEQRKKNLLHLWFSPMFPTCLCLYFCWFTNNMIGYGTTYNQSNFGSNIMLSSAMFEVATIISLLILMNLIERVNRRRFGQISYSIFFLSSAAIAASFYFEGQQKGSLVREVSPSDPINPVRLVVGMLLKLTGTICYHIIYLLAVESFPTIMRQLGVGTCSVASRFGSTLAPFTRELGILIGLAGVFSMYACLAFCAMIVVSCLTETRGKEIPNTLNECLERRNKCKDKSKS